uniref:Pancreatic trypsin inhibitor n=1 Tax=Rhipicephalus zambeziensis TaxID=60191 RepID=A0A224Y243_9ACAR
MRITFSRILTFYTFFFIPKDASSQSCSSMPDDAGDCDSHVDEWYFNSEEQKCMPFMYGDCPRNGNEFKNEDECKNICMKPGKAPPGTKGRPRPPMPSGSSEEKGGRGPWRPVKGGPQGGGTRKKPAHRPRPARPTGGRPPTKPRFPTRKERPGGGGKQWPPRERKRPGRANCGVSIKRGICDDFSSMWYNNAQFGFCSRVPEGRCPTHGAFFQSCEECMQMCHRTKVKRCNRTG